MAQVHDDLGRAARARHPRRRLARHPQGLDDIAPDDLDLVVDVNVKGTFYCAPGGASPHDGAQGGGAIVTISSIGGRQPSPVTGVPYAASKAAVVGLTERLAREVGPRGVRVNAVAPGLFLTGRLQGMYDAMPDAERRRGAGRDPAGPVPGAARDRRPGAVPASDEASYITGVVLDVNGGRFMPL